MIKFTMLMLLAMKGGGFGGFQISYVIPEITPINDMNRQYGLPEFGNVIGFGGKSE